MNEVIRVSNFLRNILIVDAITGLVCGFLLTLGGTFLENLLGLPQSLMFYAGMSLFPFTALLIYSASRKTVSKTIVWLIIGINFLWVMDSFLLLLTGFVMPSPFGYFFIISQALGVALLADLEFIALRKAEIVFLVHAQETI